MTKILFLDVDGVINNASTRQRYVGFIGIDPILALRVVEIVVNTDCEVVLSSSWRHLPEGKSEVDRQVCRIYDITPTSDSGFRGDEIKAWLANHPEVKRYAILDDDNDFYPDQSLFKTDWHVGLTDEIAAKVMIYLNAEDTLTR